MPLMYYYATNNLKESLMCEREMCVTADKTYIKINPLSTLVPYWNTSIDTIFEFLFFLQKTA